MCVASATDRHLVSDCLKRLGILPYFEFLISCEEVGRGKDSPRVYEEAARRFGAQPGKIAVYEDALFAARTARQAGFYVVGVYDRGSKDFEQLKQIRDGVQHPERIGICLDTCHVFAAGYDIVHDLDGVLDEFDRILGLELLRTIHLNDSLMPFGSRKDRHAVIGEGEIGLEALLNVLRHPKLKDLPFYLETPLDDAGHKEEIARLKEYLGEE